MRALVNRAAGWQNAQALYSNKTTRAWRNSRRRESSNQVSWKMQLLAIFGLLAFCSTAAVYWRLLLLERIEVVPGKRPISRIAFGSSASHDYSSQPVWVHGVIPSDPDVWIWLGDMAYMDEARVNCDASPNHAQCNCSGDWLHRRPNFCMSGNLEHAKSKMQTQLANPDYARFLSFMCPDHRAKGLHPPPGSDPEICPRLILGTYDDHDYGWNHGNKRLPRKDELKQIFLDAIGEPSDSPRRKPGRGIEWKYVLNEDQAGRQIDIILLDTRYYRDPLPCYRRKSFCEQVVASGPSHDQHAWCLDFLKGEDGCCHRDEEAFQEWCSKENMEEICKESFPSFTADMLASTSSGFCDVLGSEQRKWLEQSLLHSKSPLKIIVSSSEVLASTEEQPCSSPSHANQCFCSGDDWECYKPAQIDLLELISKTTGCVVLITGGMQYSDIRVLGPGLHPDYGSLSFSHSLFQVKSSGLVATSMENVSCDGLRANDPCEFVRAPSFGMIQVAWEEHDPTVKLQVLDGMSGLVKLESTFSIASKL